ncbi:DUF5107 domain-containing protein [Microbacterium sp.]|uniref:DUF5107 domain-containing protein n=1 Tax=Microbacterium sp. TaxID=51671 RepID=UPI003342418E
MTASLSIVDHVLPSAAVGAANPLPAVATMPQAPYEASAEGLPEDIARGLRYGQVTSIHPYLLQDSYDRDRTDAPMRLAVLENGHIRAEFALGLGGRLIALVDKTTGRDLLYRNAIFQPANLALRDAWFSGGAEWNIGMRGHWPLTCDPLYAAVVTAPDGEPVLRMWEYERVRGLIVQIDATLGAGAPALHVRVRVRNPRAAETGMYWWTNIAVAQNAGSRVYAPARHAYRTGYDGSLQRVGLDDFDNRPAHAPEAADYFFDTVGHAADLGVDVRPWIAALGADGAGFAHLSNAPLTGRKLFVWGDTTGGRRWCEWLGGPYFEIQAGLTTTQYEHVPMPGGATWEWTETFLPLQVDDHRRSAGWAEATDAVGAHVLAAAEALDPAGIARLDVVADAAPGEPLSEGAPWGALEQELAAWAGETFETLPGVRFSREGAEGAYWAGLLDAVTGAADSGVAAGAAAGAFGAAAGSGAGGAGSDPSEEPATGMAGSAEPSEPAERPGTGGVPAAGSADAPASHVAGASWERLLARAPQTWLTAYHRAVIAHASGGLARARELYAAADEQQETAWAARGAGQAALAQGDEAEGIAALGRAHRLAPQSTPIALELGDALLRAGRLRRLRSLLAELPAEVRALGRFRVLAVRAALAEGDREAAGRLLEDTFEVPDLREGELSMSALWREAFDDRPVPPHYDFSMTPEA